MGKTACPACGANVDVALDVDTGDTVVLEINTDASSDAPRYQYVTPTTVKRVPDTAPGDFYPDHLFDCKDANAGRTF